MSTGQRMAALVDARLLDILEHGEILLDKDGHPIVVNGEPLRKQLSAAMIDKVLKRLAQLGITAPITSSEVGKIAKAAAERGLLKTTTLPPVPDGDDPTDE